jgi:NAD(P)-dependent dehydrogenase (short-subunit alcohol dehydrogenase family)
VREAPAGPRPDARYYRHDLSDLEAIPALLDAVERDPRARHGPDPERRRAAKVRGDMLDLTPENFDWIMGINLRGAFFLAQQVARRMLAHASPQAYRSITFVTSVSARNGQPRARRILHLQGRPPR